MNLVLFFNYLKIIKTMGWTSAASKNTDHGALPMLITSDHGAFRTQDI